ncbi:predicted amino acid aldolase or racemase [Solibacillus silvestris StLB046]|uniref:Predicted amino acid aldolase or racemase n=1 Tax=Solibacillus silvestris (strain StLB046) TaxID=1002809 RepID=F2F242_SOLSS|nr:predicted amino acid aldolase or racemase [Solibacillus silvestris StLB046]
MQNNLSKLKSVLKQKFQHTFFIFCGKDISEYLVICFTKREYFVIFEKIGYWIQYFKIPRFY